MSFESVYDKDDGALIIDWIVEKPLELQEPVESKKFKHPEVSAVNWFLSLDPPETNHLDGHFGLYLHLDDPELVCNVHLGYVGEHGRCFTAKVDSDGYGDTKYKREDDISPEEPLKLHCILHILSEPEEREEESVEEEDEDADDSIEEIGARAREIIQRFNVIDEGVVDGRRVLWDIDRVHILFFIHRF